MNKLAKKYKIYRTKSNEDINDSNSTTIKGLLNENLNRLNVLYVLRKNRLEKSWTKTNTSNLHQYSYLKKSLPIIIKDDLNAIGYDNYYDNKNSLFLSPTKQLDQFEEMN